MNKPSAAKPEVLDHSTKAGAGAYADPDEFVRTLIRREMETGETAALVASIQRGLEDIEHGRYGTFDAWGIP